MKLNPKSVLAVVMLFGSATSAFAHDHGGEEHHDQPAAPQHGGQLVSVDDVRAEVLFSDTGVSVWFYDAAMKPLAPPKDGKITLTVGKDVKKVDLKVDAKMPEMAMATVAVPKDAASDLLVEGTVGGKARSIKLARPAPGAAGSPTTLKDAVAMMDAADRELAAIVKDGDLSKAHVVADRLKALGAALPALATKAGLGADDVKEITVAGKKVGLLFNDMDEAGDGGKRDEAQKVFARYDPLLATIKAKAALAPTPK